MDTTCEAFDRVFAERRPMRILVESSTDSEWVAQHLEALGHEIIVADPTYAAMYGSRTRHVKTDKRDVAALAIANRRGVYRCAHRASAGTRALRQELRVRRQLVRQRTALINLLRAVLRQEGFRLGSGGAEAALKRLEQLSLPAAVDTILAPIRAMLTALNTTLQTTDDALKARAATDLTTQRLMTAPAVGPILALTFQAVLDQPERFGGDAARASAFVGVVPSENSSAERQQKGHITKAGPGELRALLVQACWGIWRSRRAAAAPLRLWAERLAARRGRRIVIIALARRLARILYAMWRDGTAFRRVHQPTAVTAA